MLPVPRLRQIKESKASNLEVRLDSPVVSAEAGRVSGRVVFMNDRNIRVKRITVSLHGFQQVLWYTNTMTSDRVRSKDVFLSKHRDLVCPTETCMPPVLGPGNLVWPFDFDIGSNALQSIDGLGDSFVKYDLSVTIVTAGRLTKNLCAVKELKVIRTQSLDESNDLEPEQYIHGLWPGKLDYQITASSRYHYWGQPIVASLRVRPLQDGIEVEFVKLRLQESLRMRAPSKHRELFHRRELTISEVEASDHDNAALHLQSTQEARDDEWEVTLPLPNSLQACRQSLHQGRITIAHKLLIDLRARDGNGTSHQVSYQFPLVLTFPPGITFGDQGHATFPQGFHDLQRNRRSIPDQTSAPPAFENHHFDPIYRHGMMLNPVEAQIEDHSQDPAGGNYRRTSLSATQNFRFTLPEMFSDPFNCRRDSLQPVILDQTPNYDTALLTPEIFSNDIDPSPAYSV